MKTALEFARVCAAATVLACMGGASGHAQGADGPTAMVADACAGVVNPSTDDFVRPMLRPGASFAPPPPAQQAEGAKRAAEQRARDWPNLCRYRQANAALKRHPRAVFMGDS
ncbi:MAG: hypothetical protein ABIO37_10340, partial [Caulobacteraceae bacterium]